VKAIVALTTEEEVGPDRAQSQLSHISQISRQLQQQLQKSKEGRETGPERRERIDTTHQVLDDILDLANYVVPDRQLRSSVAFSQISDYSNELKQQMEQD